MLPLAVAVLTLVIVFVPIALLIARSIVSVPPNSLLVLTGRKRTIRDPETGETQIVGYRTLRSGSALQMPFLERADVLDLTELSLELALQDVADAAGALHALAVHANARIGAEDPYLQPAMERLLGMSSGEVKQIVSSTIESRIRNQFAALRLHDGVDWAALSDDLADRVRDDLGRLGIELDSLALVPDPETIQHAPAGPNGTDVTAR